MQVDEETASLHYITQSNSPVSPFSWLVKAIKQLQKPFEEMLLQSIFLGYHYSLTIT